MLKMVFPFTQSVLRQVRRTSFKFFHVASLVILSHVATEDVRSRCFCLALSRTSVPSTLKSNPALSDISQLAKLIYYSRFANSGQGASYVGKLVRVLRTTRSRSSSCVQDSALPPPRRLEISPRSGADRPRSASHRWRPRSPPGIFAAWFQGWEQCSYPEPAPKPAPAE